MRNSIGILLLVVALTGCGPDNSQSKSAGSSPHLFVHERHRDLGDMAASPDAHSIILPIENHGDAPLRIHHLIASCRCTDARIDQDVIPPGASGRLRVAVRATEPGLHSATVQIASNDRDRPIRTVQVEWNCVTPVEAAPQVVDFGMVRPGETVQRTLTILLRPPTQQTAQCISRVSAAPDALRAELDIPPADSEGAIQPVVTLTLIAADDPGVGSGSVVFDLHDTWRERLTVPVRWEVHHRLSIDPKNLFLGVVQGEKSGHGEIAVQAEPGLEIAFLSAELDPQWSDFRATCDRISSRELHIHIEAAPPASAGVHTGELRIHLAGDERSTFRVPVTCVRTIADRAEGETSP